MKKYTSAILFILSTALGFGQTTIIYEGVKAGWTPNIGPSINSVPSDAFTAVVDPVSGNLVVSNTASKEMAGGLVSTNFAVPANTKFFAFDVVFYLSPEDFGHYARGENDLKITFPGGAQANASCQWNKDKSMWQLGANDGSGWVDSGYTKPPVVGWNKLQLRIIFDGKLWTISGVRVNDDAVPFVPNPAKFANLPANASGWGPGLHPQLQTEDHFAPFVLRVSYSRVRVIASDAPVPWLLD